MLAAVGATAAKVVILRNVDCTVTTLHIAEIIATILGWEPTDPSPPATDLVGANPLPSRYPALHRITRAQDGLFYREEVTAEFEHAKDAAAVVGCLNGGIINGRPVVAAFF